MRNYYSTRIILLLSVALNIFNRFRRRLRHQSRSRLVTTLLLTFLIALFLFSKMTLNGTRTGSHSYKIFSTAMGKIDFKEIEKNIFVENGYILIKNGLIPVLKKQISMTCKNVFSSWQKVAEQGLTIKPPKELPNPDAFLLNNYAKLLHWYFDDTPHNSQSSIKTWSQELIDNLIDTVKINPSDILPTYGIESLAVYSATKHYNIKGQNGAVIGSLTPWAEAYILANGAKHVTTVDYQKISTEHSQMNFLYAPDLPSISEKYYGKYDFVVSFSSIEHSGLGRFGDPIDPIGDLREMNKIHCMLKPKGLLFLGLPVGIDSIVYNAHRIYGRIRLAMMFEGFRLLNVFKSDEIVSDQHMQQIFNDETRENNYYNYLFVLEKVE